MPPNRLLPRVVPSLLLVLAACPPGAGPRDAGVADTPMGEVRLELGSGQLHWESLVPGARVELIHGPQGGYHIFGRVRFNRLGPSVTVTFRVTPVGGGAPLNDPTERLRLAEGRGLVPNGDTWECANALLVVLTAIHSRTAAEALVGRRFRFEATVTSNLTGQSASTVREIVLVNDT